LGRVLHISWNDYENLGVDTFQGFQCCKLENHDLSHYKSVHRIALRNSDKITDRGLEYLKGVHTISLHNCDKITDSGLEYLRGARINVSCCKRVRAM